MAYNPMRSGDEVLTLHSKWDIGASGAHTKVANVPGTGFASVARTAAGKYTITFSRGLPPGVLVECRIVDWPAVDAEPFDCTPKKSGFTAETAAAAATLLYEAWDHDTTAQTELASGDQVSIVCTFLKTK